ncbi:MAG TPA: hypothetical protein VD835_09695 [Pyrinomonadaceae bacterium]|nr:hypothetical protein [Pyrinomonadaceae bacterium]
MKNYRNAIATLVLAFVFTTSAYAGEGILHTDRTPPPPPPPPQAGVIYTDTANPESEDETLTEIALSLLQILMPLL